MGGNLHRLAGGSMTALAQRLRESHPNLEPQALEVALKAVTEEAYWLIHDRRRTLRQAPNEGDLARLDELQMMASRVFGLQAD